MKATIQELIDTLPQVGEVLWIGVRPLRRAALQSVTKISADTKAGLSGDHYSNAGSRKRQVTLIQAEHIAAVSSIMQQEVRPEMLRRNVVVKGINLVSLKKKRIRMGEVLLEVTGLCHPCSRMEENLGKGGYNAMRGHGGITARILEGGELKVGDEVRVVED